LVTERADGPHFPTGFKGKGCHKRRQAKNLGIKENICGDITPLREPKKKKEKNDQALSKSESGRGGSKAPVDAENLQRDKAKEGKGNGDIRIKKGLGEKKGQQGNAGKKSIRNEVRHKGPEKGTGTRKRKFTAEREKWAHSARSIHGIDRGELGRGKMKKWG